MAPNSREAECKMSAPKHSPEVQPPAAVMTQMILGLMTAQAIHVAAQRDRGRSSLRGI
jgi:hypothetical protein